MFRRTFSLVAVFAVVLAIGYLLIKPELTQDTVNLELPFAATAQSANAENADTMQIKEMVIGDPGAPLTVIEYASFTCPHCASFHENTYGDLKKNYIDTGKIKFVFREVYFDKYGIWASMIARCAGPKKFFGLTEMLLSSQRTWARAGDDLAIVNELSKIARLAGMEEEKIQSCLRDGDKIKALVAWYKDNATVDGVRSTPSFMIDGQLYSNMDYNEFSKLLDEKLGS
mgnify:CR=1 FL=1